MVNAKKCDICGQLYEIREENNQDQPLWSDRYPYDIQDKQANPLSFRAYCFQYLWAKSLGKFQFKAIATDFKQTYCN